MIYLFVYQLRDILEEFFCLEQQCTKYEKIIGNTFYFVTKNSCTASASCLIQEITALKDAGEAKIQNMVALGEALMTNEKNKKPVVQQTISELQNKWESTCQLATEYRR